MSDARPVTRTRVAARGPALFAGVIAAVLLFPAAGYGAPTERPEGGSGVTAKLSYDDSTGTYGLARQTDISVTSLAVSYETVNYSFDVILPYVQQKGPGRAVLLPGRGLVVVPGSGSGTSSGTGDVTTGVTRFLLNQEDAGVDLDLSGIIKWNTAPASKGLGTGKKDFSLQAAIARSLGKFDFTLTGGYTFVGKVQGQGYQNAWYGSFDTSYHVNDFVTAGVTYSDGATIVNGLSGTSDITAYADFKLSKQLKLQVYGLKGRTTQSPQHGIGGSIAYDF